MRNVIRRQFSAGTFLSIFAVVLACSGTAYAAKLITGADIKDGSVGAVDLAPGVGSGSPISTTIGTVDFAQTADGFVGRAELTGLAAGDYVISGDVQVSNRNRASIFSGEDASYDVSCTLTVGRDDVGFVGTATDTVTLPAFRDTAHPVFGARPVTVKAGRTARVECRQTDDTPAVDGDIDMSAVIIATPVAGIDGEHSVAP